MASLSRSTASSNDGIGVATLSQPVQPLFSVLAGSLDDLANQFLSSNPTGSDKTFTSEPILGPETLPVKIDNLHRLEHLVQRRAWGDVHLLVEQLLHGSSIQLGSTNTHLAPVYSALLCQSDCEELALDSHRGELVWVMTIHLRAMTKLKYYQKLQTDVDSWKFCYHHHHDTTKLPKWIPWSLHIMAASTLSYTSSIESAIDELWLIRTAILGESTISLSRSIAILHVENALTNLFIASKQWRMALECLERMMDRDTDEGFLSLVCQEEVRRHKVQSRLDFLVVQAACRSELLSRQGRILLQAGALKEAETIYQRAASCWWSTSYNSDGRLSHDVFLLQITPIQLEINQGLLAFSNAKYDDALQFFRSAADQICLLQKTLPSPSEHLGNSVLPENWIEDSKSITPLPLLCSYTSSRHYINSLYSETINNVSLCALYTCRLVDALNTMESLVRQDPTAYLTERIALNLCTLYELGSDTNESTQKKKVLQVISRRFLLHDIGPECFRIS